MDHCEIITGVYLHKLVTTTGRVEMNELQRKAITKMYATLRRSLDPDPLLAELLSAELVTFDQFEDISSLSKTPEKNSRILQLIMNHGGCETFGKFCDCIEKADSAQKFLANELKGRHPDGMYGRYAVSQF